MRRSRWIRRLAVGVVVATGGALVGTACGPPPPSVSVADDSVQEGQTAFFDITLSFAAPGPVTVRYADVEGTAKVGTDYAGEFGELTFSPGQTRKAATVPTYGDWLDEDNETFRLHLFPPSGATIGDGSGTATVVDDDPPPTVIISDTSVLEGEALAFRVRLSAPSGRTTSVAYAAGDGTAEQPEDYPSTAGTLTWNPGTTTERTVSVATVEDGCREGNESVFLNLGAPQNVSLPDLSGQGTIRNDDLSFC